MNKPKELTGVAKTFLDEIRMYGVYDIEKLNEKGEWIPFVNFYSQPFTPDLLQLFEGKCFDENNGFNSTATDSEDVTVWFQDNIILFAQPEYTYKMPKPHTLSDFITLCNLAGVNLKWRGE